MFDKKIEYEKPKTLEELKKKSVKLNFKGKRPEFSWLDGKGEDYNNLTRLSIFILFVDENLDAYLTYYAGDSIRILINAGLISSLDYSDFKVDESDPQIINLYELRCKNINSSDEERKRKKFEERISDIKDSIKPLSFYGLKYSFLDIIEYAGKCFYMKSLGQCIPFSTIELENSLLHVNLTAFYERNPGSYEIILEKNIIILYDTYGKKYALQFESSQEISKAIESLKNAGYIKGINIDCEKFYEIEKKPKKVFIDKDKLKKNKKK